MRRHGEKWTEEDEEALLRMFESGDEIDEMADALRRTRTAVNNRIGRLLKRENETMASDGRKMRELKRAEKMWEERLKGERFDRRKNG